MRFDIISDTHGRLSDELLEALQGADVIMHAGDCCSGTDYYTLSEIAPIHMCLGNNDWGMDYGPDVQRLTKVFRCGLRWELCHYEERLDLSICDVAICGHTHRPFIRWEKSPGGSSQILMMNPGSPTFPRTPEGPTIGRVLVDNGSIVSTEIIHLQPEEEREEDAWGIARFFRRYM